MVAKLHTQRSLYSIRGFGAACRRTFRQPGDVHLCAAIGAFVLRVDAALDDVSLPRFLSNLSTRNALHSRDVLADATRVARLRHAWLGRRRLAARNTCYMRAFVLLRFLAPADGGLRLHLGVETGRAPTDRLHGHAWVTWRGTMLEAPPPVVHDQVQELYVHSVRAPSDVGGRA